MKNVIIIGAGGSLAGPVIEAIQKLSDVELTLFLRNKRRLSAIHVKNHQIIEGDVMNYHELKNAIERQDIVYVNLAENLEAMAKNM